MSEFGRNTYDSDESMPGEVADSLERLAQGDAAVLKDVWHFAGIAEPDMPVISELEKAKSDLRSAMRKTHRSAARQDRKSKQPERRKAGRTWKAILFFVLLSVCFIWFGNRPVIFEAPRGATSTLTLSDGSIVQLQGGSSLVKRPWFWGGSRDVVLTGEAFFNVVPDDKPFVVHTANADVTVLGTSFNVAVWPAGKEQETVLHVSSGTVFFSPDNAATLGDTLYAGQMSRLIGTQGKVSAPSTFNPEVALLWLEGGIALIDETLADVLTVLARRLDVEIVLDPALEGEEVLTWIQPRLENVEAALTDICNVATCSFERVDGKYYVK